MSDDRDGRDGDRNGRPKDDRERGDRPAAGPEDGADADRRDRDEPLGDLAAEVRGRTGERATRVPDDERADRADRSEREGPLADVAAAVDERRNRSRDDADAFESVEVGDLDGERLWEQLAADEDGTTVAVPSEQAADAGASTDRDVRTIPKATCHGCPHVGDPPELTCTRDGTEILAMPDTDHFRVAGCPMVVDGEEDIGSIAVGGGDAPDGDGTAGGGDAPDDRDGEPHAADS
ncbi:hypothetical protein M0R89_03115 [Halorussus limi]|uniref:DUF8135 domain-containing protein n=1 Tax=Halorussus limi TaxID=2938695 RepID=A0A8U0HWL1_9EURY|nr:hypothetical protein [Halorussus limi]UPV75066.1 hypothetical protein M0R89_03115 [Halorussus limi]